MAGMDDPAIRKRYVLRKGLFVTVKYKIRVFSRLHAAAADSAFLG